MNVRWVVQANLLAEDDVALVKSACERIGAEFEPVQVVPFSDALPEFTLDDRVNIYYGSTTFIARVDEALKFPIGIFYCGTAFQMSNYIAQWGAHMLNADGRETTLRKFHKEEHSPDSMWFVRPNADDKSFAGEVMTFKEAQDWTEAVILNTQIEVDSGRWPALHEDTSIMVGPAYHVKKEWRLYVVNGEVVASTQYRENHRLSKKRGAPQEVVEYVHARCKEHQLHKAFVMDIAMCGDQLFIIECGCINSAGFYHADVDAIVENISKAVKMILTIASLLIAFLGYGQTFFIAFGGLVTDNFSALPLKDVVVNVESMQGPSYHVEHITGSDGAYRFNLNKGLSYMVKYSKAGFVSKKLVVNATDVPAYPDVPFYDMDVQMVMFERIPNFDFSFFDSPIGEARYKQSVRTINWDNPWSEERRKVMASIMREYNKTYRGYYDRTTAKHPIAVADSVLVLQSDSLKDVAIVENIMARFQPDDSVSSYYDDPQAAPAEQVEKMLGLFYTVQVGVYSKPTQLDRIYNITPLNSELMDDGHIRYTSGKFDNIKSAGQYREKMVALGVRDAFVIAYFNGKRIPLEDALYLSAKFGKKVSLLTE
jgi:hypothetical protein